MDTILSTDKLKDLNKLKEKNIELNAYFCKNLFYFFVNSISSFGVSEGFLAFVPVNFSIKEKLIGNTKFRIKNLPKEQLGMKKELEDILEKQKQSEEGPRNSIISMMKAPF